MLLNKIMTLTVPLLFLLLTLTHITRGSHPPCLPRCFPDDQKTMTDCLTFHKLSPCLSSRTQSTVREAGCACLWLSYIRRTGGFQNLLDENGVLCGAWALQNCERWGNKGTKKPGDDLIALSEVLDNDDLNEDTNVEDTDVDLRTFLLEIERRLQKLEGTKDKIPAKGSDSKIEIEQPTLKTGEVYGEFNKDAGIIHAAERINDKPGEQEMLTAEKDMIGPHLGKNRWWLWNMKDDKFKLFIFSMIIIFVVFGIFVALSCSADRSEKTDKKDSQTKGDLEPDMYKQPPRKGSFPTPSDSFTKLEKRRSQFQHFIDKLRDYRRSKEKKTENSELAMFHEKMRRASLPEYNRPRQSTPVQMYQKKMVRVGVQTPIYEEIDRPPSVSDEEEVVYERNKSIDSTFNRTYEQPFPIYHRDSITKDPTYYNEPSPNERQFAELSPITEEKDPKTSGAPTKISLEMPAETDDPQRVLLPTRNKFKKKKTGPRNFIMMQMARAAR